MAQAITPVRIPLGRGGLNASHSQDPRLFPITDLAVAESVTIEDDTLRKIGGSAKINTTPISGSPRIMGIHDFLDDNVGQVLVAATGDGKIVTVVDGGIGTELKSGLGTNLLTIMREGGGDVDKKLFMVNGFNVVQVLTAGDVATHDIANPPADWVDDNQPIGLCVHGGGAGASGGGRMIGWGNKNDRNRLYLSVPGDHEDFLGTGKAQVPVFPGTGNGIRAGISFKGRFFWYKYPHGIGWLDDSSTDEAEWIVRLLTNKIGVPGPGCVVMTDDDVLFMGTDGLIYMQSAVTEFGDIRDAAIMPHKLQDFIKQNIDYSSLSRCVAEYDYAKKQASFCVTAIGSSPVVNNMRIIVDLHQPRNPSFFIDRKDRCEAIALRKVGNGSEQVVIGDNTGTLWTLNEASRSIGDAGYEGRFATQEINLSSMLRGRRAILKYLECVYKIKGDWNLSVDVELDGMYRQTIDFPMNGRGFILDEDELDVGVLGGDSVSRVSKKLYGDARRIRLTGYNAGYGEDFEILDFYVGVTPGSDRQ